MFKPLIVCLLFAPVVAQADTLQPLAVLPAPGFVSAGPGVCAANAFQPNGSISGACKYKYYTVSCRYCQLATKRYVITWDPYGLHPALGALCATTTQALAGRVVTTYLPNFTEANCPPGFASGTPIVLDGYTFQYVTSRNDGAMLLDLNNGSSYLWAP